MSLVAQLLPQCRRHPNWMAFLTFLGIVGISHWTLLFHLSTHVVGRPFEDVFGILWGLDWAQYAIFEKWVSPFFMPDVFYPHGFYVSSSSPPVWWFIVFSPLTRLMGPVITYNLLSLTIYVVAGLGMYFLVSHLGGRWLSGILAGCIYIVAPVLTIRLGGHLDILLSSVWLPYLALFSHKAALSNRPGIWLLTGMFFGAAFLGHWQFVFLSPLIPLTIISLEASSFSLRQRVVRIVKISMTALLVVLPFLGLTLYARSQMYTDTASFSIAAANFYSLSLERLFAPNPLSSLWGEWSTTTFPIVSEASFVSIGYMAMALSLVGMLSKRPGRRIYLALLAICIVGALGITLQWNGQSVVVPLPTTLSGIIRPMVEFIVGPDLMPPGEATVLPLPLAILYRIVPLMSLTRVWARYMIVGMLAIGVLAGFGASVIADHFPRFAHFIFLFVIFTVLLEGLIAPYENFTQVSDNHRPIDYWLANQEPTISLVEYPFRASNKLAMYRQSIHRQRLVNGYASIVPSHIVEASLGIWPGPAEIEVMRSWGVDYVLINGSLSESFQQEVLPTIQAIAGLCLTRIDSEPERNRQTLLFRIVQDGQECP